MYKGKAYNIFLCYRGKVDLQGGVFGSRIYDQLSKIDGFEPFFAPEVVDSGDNFMTASRQALEDVKVFVLLLTPGFFEGCSADDDMVKDEINTALKNKSMRFIPINMPGFDAKTEYTQDVRRCFESDFTDRVEHIASVPCSDPATFRTTGKLQKAIESAIKAYDADSAGQAPFANQSKATPVALKKQSAQKHFDVKFIDNEGEVQKPNLISDGASMMEIKDGVLIKGDKNFTGDLVIPGGVTSIGNYAFAKCSGLTSITISAGVTSIGEYAFYGCSGLTSITIPAGVTSIGNYAFYGCSGLTSITIPAGVTSIGNYASYGCSGLTSVTIPAGVKSIGNYAFNKCSGLTSVTIPSSVENIGEYAFNKCSGLTSVTIPSSVENIGEYAFNGCGDLTSVTIPAGVTSIGKRAFCGCSSLKAVTFPNSVTRIGEAAFWGCSHLTRIKYAGTKKQWRIIEKGEDWAYGVKCRMVICRNGLVRI